jgi:AraC family transcriptional regulator
VFSNRNHIFATVDTHARVLRPNNHLIAQSQDVGWRSLYAAIFKETAFQATEPAIRHPYLIYHLGRPTEVTRKIEGHPRERALIGPRRICLTPGGVVTRTEHSGAPEILQVYLRDSFYEAAVNEIYGCDASSAEIVPRYAILDPLLEQLAVTIISALRAGTVQDGLYIDTLAQMIAVHLAMHHSSRSRRVIIPTVKALPGWKMQHLIEFVEENLDGDLSLTRMAAEAAVSPVHLPQAFKAAIGQSPHQYVLRRRIESAKELLRTSDVPIAEVALSTGFSSQSHLSNWFKRVVGVSPATYRRMGFS